MKPVFALLLLPQFFLFLRGQGNRLQGGRDIPAHKIEIDFNLLRGVLAAFSGAFVDKDFSTNSLSMVFVSVSKFSYLSIRL
mgnify:CR=1 FL=1